LFIVVFLFIRSLHPLVSTNAAVLQLFQYFYRIILNPTTPFFSSSVTMRKLFYCCMAVGSRMNRLTA
jgi:hypothetical protein